MKKRHFGCLTVAVVLVGCSLNSQGGDWPGTSDSSSGSSSSSGSGGASSSSSSSGSGSSSSSSGSSSSSSSGSSSSGSSSSSSGAGGSAPGPCDAAPFVGVGLEVRWIGITVDPARFAGIAGALSGATILSGDDIVFPGCVGSQGGSTVYGSLGNLNAGDTAMRFSVRAYPVDKPPPGSASFVLMAQGGQMPGVLTLCYEGKLISIVSDNGSGLPPGWSYGTDPQSGGGAAIQGVVTMMP